MKHKCATCTHSKLSSADGCALMEGEKIKTLGSTQAGVIIVTECSSYCNNMSDDICNVSLKDVAAFYALTGGRRVSREEAMAMNWDDWS